MNRNKKRKRRIAKKSKVKFPLLNLPEDILRIVCNYALLRNVSVLKNLRLTCKYLLSLLTIPLEMAHICKHENSVPHPIFSKDAVLLEDIGNNREIISYFALSLGYDNCPQLINDFQVFELEPISWMYRIQPSRTTRDDNKTMVLIPWVDDLNPLGMTRMYAMSVVKFYYCVASGILRTCKARLRMWRLCSCPDRPGYIGHRIKIETNVNRLLMMTFENIPLDHERESAHVLIDQIINKRFIIYMSKYPKIDPVLRFKEALEKAITLQHTLVGSLINLINEMIEKHRNFNTYIDKCGIQLKELLSQDTSHFTDNVWK